MLVQEPQTAEAAMDDWSVMATWFRQRPGEADREWIERLSGFFEAVHQERVAPQPDDPKALRIGERVWKRYVARLSHAADR